MKKKFSYWILFAGVGLVLIGTTMIVTNTHLFWEALFIGILLLLVGILMLFVQRALEEKQEKPLALAVPFFIFLLAGFTMVANTIKVNRDRDLVKKITESEEVVQTYGSLQYILFGYGNQSASRQRPSFRNSSFKYLIRGEEQYGWVRVNSSKNDNGKLVIDTVLVY